MTFTVKRRLAQHEGGTKFYQVFQFQRGDTRGDEGSAVRRSCAATHWGAMAVARPWPNPRPVNGGQLQHLPVTAYSTKWNDKMKRGYCAAGAEETSQFHTAAEFETWVTEQLGAEEAHQVFVSMSLRGSDARLDTADDWPGINKVSKPAPKAAPDTSTIARPEGWGAW